nr:hypothetical protein CFP56_65475 [Quercus suber]
MAVLTWVTVAVAVVVGVKEKTELQREAMDVDGFLRHEDHCEGLLSVARFSTTNTAGSVGSAARLSAAAAVTVTVAVSISVSVYSGTVTVFVVVMAGRVTVLEAEVTTVTVDLAAVTVAVDGASGYLEEHSPVPGHDMILIQMCWSSSSTPHVPGRVCLDKAAAIRVASHATLTPFSSPLDLATVQARGRDHGRAASRSGVFGWAPSMK